MDVLGVFRSALVGPLLLCLALPAAADVVLYDEAVSGDLTWSTPTPETPPDTTLTLSLGTNLVRGQTFLSFLRGNTHFAYDADAFGFVVAEGMQVLSISVSFSATPTNISAGFTDFSLCSGYLPFCSSATLVDSHRFDVLDGNEQRFDFGGVALQHGNYRIRQDAFTQTSLSSGTAAWDADYVWTITVGQVAEPTSLALTLLALFASRHAARGRARGSRSGSAAA